MCLNHRAIFKEQVAVAASVNEYLWSRIWGSSPKLSKALALMKCYKKISLMKQFFKKSSNLENWPITTKNLVVKLK